MTPHKQGERLAELQVLAVFRSEAHGYLYSVRNVVTGIETMKTHAELEPFARVEKRDLG